MAKKDKFQQMKEGGGVLSSFQEIASTAAAVERIETRVAQQQPNVAQQGAHAAQQGVHVAQTPEPVPGAAMQEQLFTRLPNPEIPITEYNLVSQYVSTLRNMTRQDWVELAIVEKLHNDQLIDDDTFNARTTAIRNRPPRGQRKGFKSNRPKPSIPPTAAEM